MSVDILDTIVDAQVAIQSAIQSAFRAEGVDTTVSVEWIDLGDETKITLKFLPYVVLEKGDGIDPYAPANRLLTRVAERVGYLYGFADDLRYNQYGEGKFAMVGGRLCAKLDRGKVLAIEKMENQKTLPGSEAKINRV